MEWNKRTAPAWNGVNLVGQSFRVKCPICGGPAFVQQSIPHGIGRKRRRSCSDKDCNYKWNTLEIPEDLAEIMHNILAEANGAGTNMGKLFQQLYDTALSIQDDAA
jgi:hypothetical protein